MNELTIKQAQQQVDNWIKTIGVRYFSELTNMADEMADVLWVLICLANQTGIDLEEAFILNIEKKTNRDRVRHKDNPKLKS